MCLSPVMTNSHPRRRSRALFSLTTLLIVGIFHAPLLWVARQAVFALGVPLWSLGDTLWGGSAFADSQSAQLLRIWVLEEDKRKLLAELGHVENRSRDRASVLSSLASSPYDTFIIDQGESAGVLQKSQVVSASGIAL